MDNDLEIKKYLAELLKDGIKLSDAQSMVNRKFGCKLTFLDVRVLASELENIDWGQFNPPAPKAPPAESAAPSGPAPKLAGVPEPPASAAGNGDTVVTETQVLPPGYAAGGHVKFASGAEADWYIDEMGRLALDKPSGQPTPDDLRKFQTELRKLFS